jgi:hypothetical protein
MMELFGFAIFLIVLALFVIEWRLKKLMQIRLGVSAMRGGNVIFSV